MKIPRRISREYIRAHPGFIFIYASDYHFNSVLGQAAFAKGEPNAFPVPTKMRICRSAEDALFTDAKFDYLTKNAIDRALAKVPLDGRLIIPFPKIGLGCAKLQKNAPRTLKYIQQQLELLSGKFEWDYNYAQS